MGDIADAIQEGGLCEVCSVAIDGDAPGYPRLCDECRQDAEELPGDDHMTWWSHVNDG